MTAWLVDQWYYPDDNVYIAIYDDGVVLMYPRDGDENKMLTCLVEDTSPLLPITHPLHKIQPPKAKNK